MKFDIMKYDDCFVTRKEVIRCGADWKERQKAGLPAGEKVVVYEVARIHSDGTREVLVKGDPSFNKAVAAIQRRDRDEISR